MSNKTTIFIVICLIILGYSFSFVFDLRDWWETKAYKSQMTSIMCDFGDPTGCDVRGVDALWARQLNWEIEANIEGGGSLWAHGVGSNFDDSKLVEILNEINSMKIPDMSFARVHLNLEESLKTAIEKANDVKDFSDEVEADLSKSRRAEDFKDLGYILSGPFYPCGLANRLLDGGRSIFLVDEIGVTYNMRLMEQKCNELSEDLLDFELALIEYAFELKYH